MAQAVRTGHAGVAFGCGATDPGHSGTVADAEVFHSRSAATSEFVAAGLPVPWIVGRWDAVTVADALALQDEAGGALGMSWTEKSSLVVKTHIPGTADPPPSLGEDESTRITDASRTSRVGGRWC